MFGAALVTLLGGSARATDSNQVGYWCAEGVKIEPIGTPSFTVPEPPEGYTWTLLVIKSATDNETFPNPVPGQSYTPSNGHDVSHVILCQEPIPPPTTAPTTTTTAPVDPTTTTTAPVDPTTTTTAPVDPTTTTTAPVDPTTTTTAPVAPVQETTTTEPPPVGGVSAGGGATATNGKGAAVLWLIGGALALLGSLTLAVLQSGTEERELM